MKRKHPNEEETLIMPPDPLANLRFHWDALSDWLEAPDAGNDDIRDAAIGLCIALESCALLKAAPELLRALATLIGCAETDCLDDKSNVWRSAMIDGKAAIAKATGEA